MSEVGDLLVTLRLREGDSLHRQCGRELLNRRPGYARIFGSEVVSARRADENLYETLSRNYAAHLEREMLTGARYRVAENAAGLFNHDTTAIRRAPQENALITGRPWMPKELHVAVIVRTDEELDSAHPDLHWSAFTGETEEEAVEKALDALDGFRDFTTNRPIGRAQKSRYKVLAGTLAHQVQAKRPYGLAPIPEPAGDEGRG